MSTATAGSQHATPETVPAAEAQAPTGGGRTPPPRPDPVGAARGVEGGRLGEHDTLHDDAELFLLTDPGCLVMFGLVTLMDTLSWLKPRAVFVRLHDTREHGYHERVVTEDGKFTRLKRVYDASDLRLSRMALTTDREVARAWQQADDPGTAWQDMRRRIERRQRTTVSLDGRIYFRFDDSELARCLKDIAQVWRRPETSIAKLRHLQGRVWADGLAAVSDETKFIGPVWIGAGRDLTRAKSVVGPAILWDHPEHRPTPTRAGWGAVVPPDGPVTDEDAPVRLSTARRWGKRAFDIFAALVGLALTIWFFPLIALAIYFEPGRESGGRPIFFGHKRETLGGKEFPCLKFRTMRKDAEELKKKLLEANQADGPQFFIDDDPRITKVGRFLRKTNLDELPQFFNVLAGHMSMVGPRPSPRKENQFCPTWRETRLSVRPGITGLWQVKRSRQEGRDFEEWIRYDIEYVERMSFRLDLWIIFKTIFGGGADKVPDDEG